MGKEKVALITPPSSRIKGNISGVYPLPPLGIAYIAAVLKQNFFSVDIFDMPVLKMGVEQIERAFLNSDYFIFGISCNIFNLREGIKLAKIIKGKKPEAKVIVGGACTVFSDRILFKYGPWFDVVVRGEGEQTMLELCKSYRDNKPIDNLLGIAYKKGNKIVSNLNRPYTNLGEIPFPARHLLLNEKYKMHPPFGIYPPLTIMETSRGCPYKCTFCTISKVIRFRPIVSVIEEIKCLIKQYEIKEIHFVDPTFTYSQNRIFEFCEEILSQRIEVHWTCKTRVDLVNKELLKMMAKAGCYMISYGVESGSFDILDSIKKGIRTEDIEEAFILTRNAGIRSIAYMLIGVPGENYETVNQNIKFVEKIKPDFVLYGELLPTLPAYSQSSEKDKKNFEDVIADFYIHGNRPDDIMLHKDTVNKWLLYAFGRFYLRPGYILSRIKNLKNKHDVLNLLNGALFLLKDKIKGLGSIT